MQDTPGGHQRRTRYRGTHPRAFHEKYKELDPARYRRGYRQGAGARRHAGGESPADHGGGDAAGAGAAGGGDRGGRHAGVRRARAGDAAAPCCRAGACMGWMSIRWSCRKRRRAYAPRAFAGNAASAPHEFRRAAATARRGRVERGGRVACRSGRFLDADGQSRARLHFQARRAARPAHEPGKGYAGVGAAGDNERAKAGAPAARERR